MYNLRCTEGKAHVRVLTSLVALPILLFVTWKPELHLVFSIIIALISGVGFYEYFKIVQTRDIIAERTGGVIAGVLIVFSGHSGHIECVNGTLFAACIIVTALHVLRNKHSVPGILASVFGLIYVGWFGAHIVLLRAMPGNGAMLVTLLFVAVMLADTGAYVVGSLIGKHKLAPAVSPNKTWEGALGGITFTMAGMSLFWYFSQGKAIPVLSTMSLEGYLVIGLLLALTSQLGDLVESCMKRDADIKDSGSFFPGHGGVLDRCDGLLFAAPVLFYAMYVIKSIIE